jgi:hypothetical protein
MMLFCISLHSQDHKELFIGELLQIGESKGRSYLSIKDQNSGQKRHILCEGEWVKNLSKPTYDGRKPEIHVWVKKPNPRIDIWECLEEPEIRSSGFKKNFKDLSKRYVAGQVLESYPDQGLLYLQNNRRRFHLNVGKEKAKEYKEKIEKMELVKIQDYYRYNPSLGYFEPVKE